MPTSASIDKSPPCSSCSGSCVYPRSSPWNRRRRAGSPKLACAARRAARANGADRRYDRRGQGRSDPGPALRASRRDTAHDRLLPRRRGVIGSIRSSEPVTRLLAAQTGCTVALRRLSARTRGSPSCRDRRRVAAYHAMLDRLPAGARIGIAGDSFGGYLCAHVDRAATRKPDLQVLIYPMVDQTMSRRRSSVIAEGYLLTKAMIAWFRTNYLRATDDLRASRRRTGRTCRAAPRESSSPRATTRSSTKVMRSCRAARRRRPRAPSPLPGLDPWLPQLGGVVRARERRSTRYAATFVSCSSHADMLFA